MFFSDTIRFQARFAAIAAVAALATACGGSGGSGGSGGGTTADAPSSNYKVGGKVSGLAGTLVLQNNGSDDLRLTADGTFAFTKPVSGYEVSVRTQPLWQFCTVAQGRGSASSDVGDVSVSCAAAAAEVSTLAGSGALGSADGKGTAASFALPFGVAISSAGDLFVSDMGSRLLRKISPAGDVTTFAGDGAVSSGPVDGNGKAASFQGIAGIAVDAAGNIYAADYEANRIRKITPSADVTTLAGNGMASSIDGTGTSATFNRPGSVGVDGAGNIYATELDGFVVRKLSSSGAVTTLAGAGASGYGDGRGAAAYFSKAYGTAVDAAGNVYVADTSNNRIRKITPDGVVTTLAGSGQAGDADGTGSGASFREPTGLAVDVEGNLYVADTVNSLIRRITPAGVVSTLAGQFGVLGSKDGIGAAATFAQPAGLAVDVGGTVYVADSGGNVIRKITPVPPR